MWKQLIAEVVGTYFLIFAGGASVVVNLSKDKVISFPGIAIVWGLVVMVMVYSVGHISGAHFNPAVTIAFATTKRFPWKQVNKTNYSANIHLFLLLQNGIFFFGLVKFLNPKFQLTSKTRKTEVFSIFGETQLLCLSQSLSLFFFTKPDFFH